MAAQRRRSDKLLERMKNNPRGDWKLSDVETLAKRYGFSIRHPRGGGSHVTLLHASHQNLSIPARRPIKSVYIRKLVRMIERILAANE